MDVGDVRKVLFPEGQCSLYRYQAWPGTVHPVHSNTMFASLGLTYCSEQTRAVEGHVGA